MNSDVDFKTIKKARIYLRGECVGGLERKSEEEHVFWYDEHYINKSTVQIATSLPIRKEPYKSKKLHPFFDNMISEGWLLQHTEKVFHIDKSNRFALLMATGKDPIGAVTVHPQESNGQEIDLDDIFKYDLEHKKLSPYHNIVIPEFSRCPSCFKLIGPSTPHVRCAKEMWGTTRKLSVALDPGSPQNSFARVIYGGSISGAQKKGMFRLDRSRGLLTPMARGAQYILKPSGDYPELPQNEHVTMAIARELGFEVPTFSILNIEGIGIIFAIKRFDRHENESLMMEDMGQVINVPSTDKYQSSCEKVAKAIVKFCSAPRIDLDRFYRRLIFCYYISNADMHLKNWSLIENQRSKGTYKLSPCYDLLNTRLPIPEERIDIGLPINGKSRNLKKTYFKGFGESIGLSSKAVDRPFEELDQWWTVTENFVRHSLLSEPSKEKYLEIVKLRHEILRG